MTATSGRYGKGAALQILRTMERNAKKKRSANRRNTYRLSKIPNTVLGVVAGVIKKVIWNRPVGDETYVFLWKKKSSSLVVFMEEVRVLQYFIWQWISYGAHELKDPSVGNEKFSLADARIWKVSCQNLKCQVF